MLDHTLRFGKGKGQVGYSKSMLEEALNYHEGLFKGKLMMSKVAIKKAEEKLEARIEKEKKAEL